VHPRSTAISDLTTRGNIMTRTQQQQAEWETWRYDQRATEEDLARYARALVRDSALTVTSGKRQTTRTKSSTRLERFVWHSLAGAVDAR